MKICKKNKKGFTLIELMLAIAIICLIVGLFAELIFATIGSYYRTYNANDATDYAQLYAQALENNILRICSTGSAGNHEIKVVPESGSAVPYILSVEGSDAFNSQLAQMKNGNGVEKWQIYIGDVSYTSTTGMFSYKIYMVDNYRNPGELVLEYEGSFWIPQAIDSHSAGRHISIAPGSTSSSGPGGSTLPFSYNQKITITVS